MTTSIRPLAFVLALVLTLASFRPALADEPQPVRLKEIPRSERRLAKGVEGVAYSDKTYRFSRSTKVRLQEDQSLVLTVWSADFRPTIQVRSAGSGRVLAHGTHDPAKAHEGRDWYVTRLQFTPPDRGVFVVSISTEGLDTGTYVLEGAIWGYEAPKPAAEEPEAPAAGTTSTAGFDYEPYKPFASKQFHYRGGAYKQGGTFAAEVGVTWLEGGDARETLGSPTDAKSRYGKIARREGTVFHFEPETMGRGAKQRVSSYKIMIFHPEKELHVLIRVQAAHAASIPAFIAKGQALYEKYAADARPKP